MNNRVPVLVYVHETQTGANIVQNVPADLVTFTEQIHNGKLHFLSSEKFFSG